MPAKPGSIVHVELHSADPARSKAFYGQVFGWKFEESPEMNYTTWKAANEPAGGLMKTIEGRPPQVLNYILSNNIDATVNQITGAGGSIIQPKMEIPGMGWWALFQEPGGTMMAVYQNLQRPRAASRPRRIARPRRTARKATKRSAGRKRRR